MCDRKLTPSSVTLFRSESENTWYPPLSVRMGPSQPMNLWSPPNRAISSAPGRWHRWYVLPSRISAPLARTCSGQTPLTVPAVPTGMNAGSAPARAAG